MIHKTSHRRGYRAVLTVMATQPGTVFDVTRARAAAVDTYRQLTLFGDVFEQVRSDYVERPDDGKLIESAIDGLGRARSPFELYGCQDLCGICR